MEFDSGCKLKALNAIFVNPQCIEVQVEGLSDSVPRLGEASQTMTRSSTIVHVDVLKEGGLHIFAHEEDKEDTDRSERLGDDFVL